MNNKQHELWELARESKYGITESCYCTWCDCWTPEQDMHNNEKCYECYNQECESLGIYKRRPEYWEEMS